MAGGGLVFTNQKSVFNNNHYVHGAGVGALNISVRRHLKRFATSPHPHQHAQDSSHLRAINISMRNAFKH
jgi:hypothetical protein